MTIRTGLDMAAKRCGATLHDGVGGSAHVGGQGMALLIGRKRVLEDRLERWSRRTASMLPLSSGIPPSAPRTGQVAFTTSGAPTPAAG